MLLATRYRNLPLSANQAVDHSGCSMESIVEAAWFLLALLLFVILGPFAAPAALVAIFTSGRDSQAALPEPEQRESFVR